MVVNKKRALGLLQELIQLNTVNPPGNELKAANVIASHVNKIGMNSEIKMIAENRANIIVQLKGNNPDKPKLLFSGHLDTVPVGNLAWDHASFGGNVIDGKIYGRGACDMKGGVAGMIEAMTIIKESGIKLEHDLIFVGSAGEEVDCIGAKEFVKDGAISNPGAMIISEPSNNRVFSAHKGALWLEIRTSGKTAHGSMPDEGINAITHMNMLINELLHYQFQPEYKDILVGKPSLSIGTINGGVKTNVVPDECTLTIDIRTTPKMDHGKIVNEFMMIIDILMKKIDSFRAEVSILHDLPPLSNTRGNQFVNLALKVANQLDEGGLVEYGVNYYTDASIYRPGLNIPIVIYGPGDEKLAHQPNEYLDLGNFYRAIKYYVEMAKRF